MKNKLILLGATAVIVAAAAGIHYRIPVVIALVCLGIAVFSAVSGVQMIITRKADIPMSEASNTSHERHTGLSAVFWGILFVMFSVPFGAFGIGVWVYGANPPGEIIDRLARSPLASGLVIVTVGLGIVLYGLTRVLPGRAAFAETGIGPVERGLTAVYASTIGTVVVVAGIMHMRAPGMLTRMRDAAITWVLALVK